MMRTREHNVFLSGLSLLMCGLLSGVVIAAAMFPAVALSGIVAKASAKGFGELPSELDTETRAPQMSEVYANDNKTLIARFYEENRRDIPLEEVPEVVRNAILAAEDQDFYKHKGVDWQGVIRAFVSNLQGKPVQGASTLTMQYVRNQMTYTASSPAEVIAATEDTMARKIREMRLALIVESTLTKDEIFERYLNIAAFGHGAYGIWAAANVFFDKAPKDLTLEEAALLAALPKAPSEYDPATEEGREKALGRRNWVLGQMASLNMITPEERDAAMATEIKVTGKRTPNGCIQTMVDHWAYFCDYFARWWVEQEAFGATPAEREARLKAGGYRIVTTLDPKLQASAKSHVEKELKTGNRDAMMVAAIEPGTGRVKALATNRVYSLDDKNNPLSSDPAKKAKGIKATYPNTTNPLLTGGGDIFGYKAGSTFKIFTIVAALERGYTLDFEITTVSPYKSKYLAGVGDLGVCPDRIHWCPQNAGGSSGPAPRNMWTGFGWSVNTYFVPLQEKVGSDRVIDVAQRMGIKFRDPNEIRQIERNPTMYGPFTLGVTSTVPLELANAYATLAADGTYCEPTPVLKVFDFYDRELPEVVEPRCKQVIKPEIAHAAIDAARCPVNDRGGLGRCNGATTTGSYFVDAKGRGIRTAAQAVGYPVFGKTGTTETNWTANFVISTKQLTVAATLANPDRAETPHDTEAPRRTNRVATHTLRDGMVGLEKIDFPAPPRHLVVSEKVRVPNVKCLPVKDAEARLRAAGFDVQVENEQVPSDECAKGTVAETSPEGGQSTSKRSTVVIKLSNGERKTPLPTTPPGAGGPGGPGEPPTRPDDT